MHGTASAIMPMQTNIEQSSPRFMTFSFRDRAARVDVPPSCNPARSGKSMNISRHADAGHAALPKCHSPFRFRLGGFVFHFSRVGCFISLVRPRPAETEPGAQIAQTTVGSFCIFACGVSHF